MDNSSQQWNFSEGTDVVGSDGNKVGEVVAVHQNYVVVEKGFFFPTDYYIPTSAVASYDDGRVYLSVTKDAALNQGWDAEPTGGYAEELGGTATTATTYETDAVAPVATGSVDMGTGADLGRTDAGYGVAATGATTTGTTRVEAGETISVPVHEEELTATTRQREIGEVEIEKDVVAEQRTIQVPVTEERVRVERRTVDRPAEATDAAFQEGVIEVPIRGEEVELQKRVRVAEEVEIGKEAVQRTEQVAGTVRREEVRVTEDVAEVTGSSARTATGATGETLEEGQSFYDQNTDTVRDTGRGI